MLMLMFITFMTCSFCWCLTALPTLSPTELPIMYNDISVV